MGKAPDKGSEEWATTRYHAIKALVDGATSQGERTAAQHALDMHVRKYGEPVEKTPPVDLSGLFRAVGGGRLRPEDELHRLGRGEWGAYCRWKRVTPELSPELQRALAPDFKCVLMSCVTTRKEHRCIGCGETYPRRTRMWRPIVYNGNHRMDRLCTSCFAPDPKAKPLPKAPVQIAEGR